MGRVVGRNSELEAIESLLAGLAEGPAALVFEGEPGIGKTTLVRAGIEAAARHGARVQACAPSAPETRLSYAALADLLAGMDARSLKRLPAPQREALDAALLRSAPGAGGVERRAVATAVLSLLEGLAEERPVLIAIDDLQWLDRPSARVVEFCARRVAGGVGLIASRRVGEEAAWARDLIRLRQPERLRQLEVAPLEVLELGRLLREHAEQPLERRALVHLHEASGGNPFYALELARAIPPGGAVSAGIPLPASLDEIVTARVAGLGEDAMEVLLTVAALSDPTVEVLEHAHGPGVAELLDEAERRGVIELSGTRPRFTHPLLANGVYARVPSGRRRALHRRLSDVVADVEERARHLALAGVAREAIAALDEAARHVRARGAPDAAAELLELALVLGGGPELVVRAAEHHFDAGDPRRARALLEEAISALEPGVRRARALLLLAEVHYKDESFPEARELLEHAQNEAGSDERLQAMIELRLTYTLFNLGLLPAAAEPARSAVARAERIGDSGLISQALGVSVMIDYNLGLGIDESRLARALDLEDQTGRAQTEFGASLIASFIFLWTAQFERARAELDALERRLAERGEETALAWAMGFTQVWLELWSGDVASATRAVDARAERLLLIGTTISRALAATARAMVHAYAGRVDEARRSAEEGLELFERAGWRHATAWPVMTLGFVDMSVGDFEAVAARLGPAAAVAVATGLPEPTAGGALFTGDAAEALVAVGRIDEAEAIVSLLEERGEALDRPWAVAVGARCRGLILAADGDATGAEQALERGLKAHERLPMPIERARSLLVLGRIRRRLRKRRAAKAVLDEALQIFETVGSPLWAQQVREEIDCLGLRPTAAEDLTPSEERVATLAAAGHTNREVAASLNVSEKTVEAQLSRAYRKLGIHSRAELGARMAAGPATDRVMPDPPRRR